MPVNTAAGVHTGPGDGDAYEYEATWQRYGYHAHWRAEVRRGQQVVRLDGEISLGNGSFDLEAAVKRAVECRIAAGDFPV